MKTLGSMIQERAKDMDVQLTKAREVSPDESRWIRVKAYVRRLPFDYKSVFMKALQEEGSPRIKRHRRNTTWDIDVSARFEGIEILLNIVETFTGEVKRASYFAFDKGRNVCFVRDLLKEDVLSQF